MAFQSIWYFSDLSKKVIESNEDNNEYSEDYNSDAETEVENETGTTNKIEDKKKSNLNNYIN